MGPQANATINWSEQSSCAVYSLANVVAAINDVCSRVVCAPSPTPSYPDFNCTMFTPAEPAV